MRFVKSNRRLVLDVSGRQVEAIVLTAVRVIVPRYTRKLYFLGEVERVYPELERLAKERAGFTVVRDKSEPSNLLNSFRIVHREMELFIVPGRNSRLAPEDWESILGQLEKAADNAKGSGTSSIIVAAAARNPNPQSARTKPRPPDGPSTQPPEQQPSLMDEVRWRRYNTG